MAEVRIYARIAAEWRQRIESGELRADDPLPPIGELARRYGVSRDSVQHAYQVLQAEGLIRRVPGRGYFCGSQD